jgi:hypothetical protein
MKLKLTLITALIMGAPTVQANPLSPLVALGAVPYRAGRWVMNAFKSATTLEEQGRQLNSKLDDRYGQLIALMDNQTITESAKHDQFVQLVGQAHQEYLAQAGKIIQFARKNSFCSNYEEIVNYPFMHFINRTQAILSWVTWYTSSVEAPEVKEMMQKKSKQLIAILAYARASEEYATEAALLPTDRYENRKSMLYFMFVRLPILSAGFFVCGAGLAAIFIYRMFSTSRLGEQVSGAAGDAGDIAKGLGALAANGIQELRANPEFQTALRNARDVAAGRNGNRPPAHGHGGNAPRREAPPASAAADNYGAAPR